MIHVQDGSANYSAGTASIGSAYDVLRVGIPTAWSSIALPWLGAAYVGLAVGALASFARAGGLSAIVAPGLLVLTQAMWFAIPAALRLEGLESGLALAFAATYSGAPAEAVAWLEQIEDATPFPDVPRLREALEGARR